MAISPVAETQSSVQGLIEDWLRERGVEFEFIPHLDLDSIDMESSLRNQARSNPERGGEPLIEDFVHLYASAMEDGATFPPIIVYRRGKGAYYIVIDGNHRVAALQKLEREVVPAYVVHTSSQATIEALTYEANSKHGIPTSPKERELQAVYLVERGKTHADVGRLLNIPAHRVTQLVTAFRTRERLQAMNVKNVLTLSESHFGRLSAIRNDPVLKATAQLVLDLRMSVPDLSKLVTSVGARRSEKDQLAYLAKIREERAAEIEARMAGALTLPPVIRRLVSAVGALLALPEDLDQEMVDSWGISDEYRAELSERLENAAKQIARYAKVVR